MLILTNFTYIKIFLSFSHRSIFLEYGAIDLRKLPIAGVRFVCSPLKAVKILSDQGYKIRRLDQGYPEWKMKQLEKNKS